MARKNNTTENYINLDKIPKYKKWNYDWKNASGIECEFVYGDVKGVVTIKDYIPEKQIVVVEYKGETKEIATELFKKCNIGSLIGVRTKDFKIEIGTIFNDKNRNYKITDRKREADKSGIYRKKYKCKCNICGWDKGWKFEEHILSGIGCGCCSKQVLVPGLNDIATTNPEYIKYFKYQDDARYTTTRSKKIVDMVCPYCKNEQQYSTDLLIRFGYLPCKKCGDGFPYGEKFIYSFLSSMNVDFITQLSKTTFKWCGNYKYDFYLPDTNTIIEVNGLQHYAKSKFGDLKEVQENDYNKKKLALENSISNYIVLDCRESNLKTIKNSIIKSNLLDIIKVNEDIIDWIECDKYTTRSIVYYVSEYKNNHFELSTTDIAKIFHLARTTIQLYLQRGKELGICIYDKEFEKRYKNKEARYNYYNSILNNENTQNGNSPVLF